MNRLSSKNFVFKLLIIDCQTLPKSYYWQKLRRLNNFVSRLVFAELQLT